MNVPTSEISMNNLPEDSASLKAMLREVLAKLESVSADQEREKRLAEQLRKRADDLYLENLRLHKGGCAERGPANSPAFSWKRKLGQLPLQGLERVKIILGHIERVRSRWKIGLCKADRQRTLRASVQRAPSCTVVHKHCARSLGGVVSVVETSAV